MSSGSPVMFPEILSFTCSRRVRPRVVLLVARDFAFFAAFVDAYHYLALTVPLVVLSGELASEWTVEGYLPMTQSVRCLTPASSKKMGATYLGAILDCLVAIVAIMAFDVVWFVFVPERADPIHRTIPTLRAG